MKTGNLKIRSIESDYLATELEKAIEARRGVEQAVVQPGDPAAAEVRYDELRTSLEQIVSELRGDGYDAEIGGYSAGGAP